MALRDQRRRGAEIERGYPVEVALIIALIG